MPKGQMPKLKGSICNVPIDTADVANTLPQGADSNGIVMIKLKRKLVYRGHVYFEAVSPEAVRSALEYLKWNNPLYHDILIDIGQIPANLLSLAEPIDIPIEFESANEISDNNANIPEETDDPLDNYRFGATETMLLSNIPQPPEDLVLAPGEGIQPLSILMDEKCEELAHPFLFPTGKFGYRVERDIKLSPVKYFNQRLLNYKQKFASDSDYIFYALSVMLQLNLNSQINIAMKKVCANQLTAGMLSNNFSDTVKSFIAKDESFNFMNSIKGTPAYWKKFLFEVLAMVKQLGLPTFFMTLSCADLRWNELIAIISKLKGENLTGEDINNMSYFERCRYLNLNPVLLARHFQYRVEVFFKEIVVNGPLGKVTYYAIRVEFQVRGSPHIHSFLWVLNAPILTKDNIDEYVRFVDAVIRAYVPDIHEHAELHKLVTTYQIHSHSKSCRKYKNQSCRYHFGRFFTDRTIIAVPLSKDMSLDEKTQIIEQRKLLLSTVKEYIDSNLDPKKRNILKPQNDNFEEVLNIKEILEELKISEDDYYKALSISDDSDFQIHLKRPPNSCFVNNYFDEGLIAWKANIDIQPVFNHYKAVTYMCAYFSKSEDETSEAMKQAAKEAFNSNKNNIEQMRSIARAYANKRECSVQEAVYILMPELWLRKTFPGVIFANSNLPENRFRICRSKEEIDELPEDSTDIFKRNMIDRYIDRPNHTFSSGKFSILDTFCFAEFVAHYYLLPKNSNDSVNDSQPTVLQELLLEVNHSACNYPSTIPLMNSKEKLKCRQVKAVLRYHVPNRHKFPEKYAHHLLFMFYPFRNEHGLKSDNTGTYAEKLQEPGIIDIVNRNKQVFEPYGDLVESALLNMRTNLARNQDSYANQENDQVDELLDTANALASEDPADDAVILDDNSLPSATAPTVISDDELNTKIRSLNQMQREYFEIIYDWAKRFVKNLSAVSKIEIKPLYIFLTGGAGTGKSHLIKTIYHALTKTFSYRAMTLDKPKVLLVAPTGVAAVNIDGTTIHTSLGIPVGRFGKNLPRLNDKKRSALRNKLCELRALIIDEISMVSNLQLLYIHLRLVEIFGSSDNVPFAGLTVIVVGDFYQLPPVQQRTVYAEYNDAWQNLVHLWNLFKIAELLEVMRQRGDTDLIDLLNKVRTSSLEEVDEKLLKSHFIKLNDDNYPHDALHIFAENKPCQEHNRNMLNSNQNSLRSISAIDDLPKKVSKDVIEKALNRNQSETGGLAKILEIKINARVMLTVNIDIADRLINGQIGTVMHISSDVNGQILKIYIKFDDVHAGLKKTNTDPFARQRKWVPIEKAESSIIIRINKDSSPVIKRTQFPLMLAWACTVHKVQGLSLDRAVISFQLLKQRSFNNGQMYVALSRVTSLNGLFLTGEYKSSAIKADTRASQEYERMRRECEIEPLYNADSISEATLTVTLLNTRSLHRHAVDISHDQVLLNTDVLCLTETQLLPNQDTNSISEILNAFSCLHNNCADKFQSTSFCYKSNVDVVNYHHSTGISVIDFKKSLFSPDPIRLVIVYRKNNTCLSTFYNTLADIVQLDNIHVILGDFNINAQDPAQDNLLQIFQNYQQIVQEPTHLGGATLDHIYLRKNFVKDFNLTYFVKCVYFSDHDAIQFKLIL